MKISVIQVPWDSGHQKKRMGLGPVHLIEQGLADHLKRNSEDVELSSIEIDVNFPLEIGTTKAINTLLAEKVKLARSQQRLPVILAGNCNTASGTTAGLQVDELGVVWFDAHGDFNTPETSVSGFFDGMALSVLAGNCWRNFAKAIPGFKKIDVSKIVLAGARDFDEKEELLLRSSLITHLKVNEIREKDLLSILPSSLHKGDKLYVHIDLDVFDPSELTANQFSVKGGLLLAEFLEIFKRIKSSFEIAAVAFTAYDPEYDAENQAYKAVKEIMDILIKG